MARHAKHFHEDSSSDDDGEPNFLAGQTMVQGGALSSVTILLIVTLLTPIRRYAPQWSDDGQSRSAKL